MTNFDFVRVAAASPKLKIANPDYNSSQILNIIKEAEKNNSMIVVFPELSMTGYTCGDLFGQHLLLEQSQKALKNLLNETKECDIIAILGMPVLFNESLYNCAVVTQKGKILGIVPKTFIPNYKEFYEKRWFSSGYSVSEIYDEIDFMGSKVPFGNLLFKNQRYDFTLGVEICEDLWVTIPPSSYMSLNGANIIANLSASNEYIGKSEYRRHLVSHQSAACMAGYIYASSGVYESTTDIVFGGHCIISENGTVLKESERFQRENTIVYTELDIDRLMIERQSNKSYEDNYRVNSIDKNFRVIEVEFDKEYNFARNKMYRKFYPHPFIPADNRQRDERCGEIFSIQAAGLAKRMEHTGLNHAVIGVSGGLDSTLALLVAAETFKTLNIPSENIIGVTMPGFGTTDHTYNNALELMKSLNITIKEVDIKASVIQHFKDIGHDIGNHDVTYENAQARERTQILMDIANKYGGLVVGTGDLSELALGWATFNGDHMSMYGVNSSVPKTLVKYLVDWVSKFEVDKNTQSILQRILDTPISPELLPPDKEGKILQKTEDKIGPYELHDFFIYYVLRFGMSPKKILFMAQMAFENKYSKEEITKWLKLFYKRFFANQFKRSTLPDGPKVGSVSLSPRGDWRMPSDADVQIWLNELE